MKDLLIVLSLALLCGCSSGGVQLTTDLDNEGISSDGITVAIFGATLTASRASAAMAGV